MVSLVSYSPPIGHDPPYSLMDDLRVLVKDGAFGTPADWAGALGLGISVVLLFGGAAWLAERIQRWRKG